MLCVCASACTLCLCTHAPRVHPLGSTACASTCTLRAAAGPLGRTHARCLGRWSPLPRPQLLWQAHAALPAHAMRTCARMQARDPRHVRTCAQVMRAARQAADAAAAAAATHLPASMRSGLRAPAGVPSPSAPAAAAAAAASAPGMGEGSSVVQPVVPVALGSWWVVRFACRLHAPPPFFCQSCGAAGQGMDFWMFLGRDIQGNLDFPGLLSRGLIQ